MVESPSDYSTLDLAETRIRLRDELVFAPQKNADGIYCHIELPSASRFFRIGYDEYVFISLLDGETTFAQALTIAAQQLGADAPSKNYALMVYRWLLENNLADFVDGPTQASPRIVKSDPGRILSKLNPFWLKLSVFRPDRWLAKMEPYLRWIFSWPMSIAGFLIMLFAGSIVLSDWDRFASASQIVFSQSNWGWMLLAWAFLKIVHELAHGLVCKRYGGTVRDFGIVFILLAPMAYVDVTSSWRFSSKWQRMHVAIAGMHVELIVAALATIWWHQTESEWVAHLLYNLIFMASVTTVVFNLNPLMRFDGYFLLSDFLGLPNLYSRGSQAVRSFAKRLFFGCVTGNRELGIRGWFVGFYGAAAFAWRLFICASLLIAASTMFGGFGLLLAATGIVSWFLVPALKLGSEIRQRYRDNRISVCRAILVSVNLVAFGMCCYWWVPNPGLVSVPGVVEYKDQAVVRSVAQGFVRKIFVDDHQFVRPGDLLVQLENDDLELELADVQHQIQQCMVRSRIAMNDQNQAAVQIEQRNQQALMQRKGELQTKVNGLLIQANRAGTVVARNLSQLTNTFVDEGQEILLIGDEQKKELLVSIDQRNVEEIQPRIGMPVTFRIGSRNKGLGQLQRMDPRASKVVPHEAFCSTAGGALTVVQADSDSKLQDEVELTEPRFRATVAIPPSESIKLFAGERGYATIGWSSQSLGVSIRTQFQRWIVDKLADSY